MTSKKIQFTISLPEQAIDLIEKLEPHGIYGDSRAEIARNLILDALKKMVADGTIDAKISGPSANS